jgi:hypothetical protein
MRTFSLKCQAKKSGTNKLRARLTLRDVSLANVGVEASASRCAFDSALAAVNNLVDSPHHPVSLSAQEVEEKSVGWRACVHEVGLGANLLGESEELPRESWPLSRVGRRRLAIRCGVGEVRRHHPTRERESCVADQPGAVAALIRFLRGLAKAFVLSPMLLLALTI